MSVYKHKRSPFYHYDFQRGGRRHTGSTGCTSRREAEAFERSLIRAEEGNRRVRGAAAATLTLAAAADRYWAEVCKHGASPDADVMLLDRLAALVGPDLPVDRIGDAELAAAVATRRAEFRKGRPKLGTVSASTVNRSVTQLLRRVLTRARKVWKVKLPDEPNWEAHVLAEPQERVRELRYDEEAKLEAVERDDYRAPRLFAQMTGLRKREVVGLTWRHVDFAAGVIRVVGKGNKRHEVPITAELDALLRPLLGAHPEAVFTYRCLVDRRAEGTKPALIKGAVYPITPHGLVSANRKAIARAGIADFRPMHDFRHTAATRTLRATGNLRLVQRLLNHASPATTAKYGHVSLEDMREGMARTAADSASRREKSRTLPRTDPPGST